MFLAIFLCLWLNYNEVIFRNNNQGINSVFIHILTLTSFWLDHGMSGQGAVSLATTSTLRSMQLNWDLHSNSFGQANVNSRPPPQVDQGLFADPNAEWGRWEDNAQ